MEQIYNGDYVSKSICEAPHRARGDLTIKETLQGTAAIQVPVGEMVKLPFTGAMPTTATDLPLVRARGMYFEDLNPLAAKADADHGNLGWGLPQRGSTTSTTPAARLQVYGTLTITSAASEETVTHYHLYYGALELS
eukprot:Skav220572  [mRNA]  locus=scaffold145:87246:89579:- [translate_table: standard]